MVFSCGASRNKRGREASFNGSLCPNPKTGSLYPTFFNLGRPDAREERQLSTRERRVAGRPWAGVRPARPFRVARTPPPTPPKSAKFAASGECNKPRRVAVRRKPGGSTNRKSTVHLFLAAASGERNIKAEAASKRRSASLRDWRLRPARLCESQELGPKHHPILLGSGRALRGWAKGPARRPGGSTNRNSTTNNSAQPTAPCSAQRGAKTDCGFRA